MHTVILFAIVALFLFVILIEHRAYTRQAMAVTVYVRPYNRVRAYTHTSTGIKTGKYFFFI